MTRFALRHRAAEYFKETRKPREAWKTLDDLAPQLAEFDLRLIGEDYDAAANVLLDIDVNYLGLWGHYRLLVDRYERLQRKLADPDLEFASTGGLGNAYRTIGRFEEAIRCFEDALALARAHNHKQQEAVALLNLGGFYIDTGDQRKAMELYQQALASFQDLNDKSGEALARGGLAMHFSGLGRLAEAIEQYERAIALHKDVGNRESECRDTYNLALVYGDLGENAKASRLAGDARQIALTIGYRLVECGATGMLADLMVREGRFEDAIREYDGARALADDSNAVQMQMGMRFALAWAWLLAGDRPRARTFAEEAAKYRFPSSYASTLALGGVVALRQGDTAAASKAFDMTLRETDAQLAGTARAYDSAYAKALALAGLALCRDTALARAAAEAYRDARAVSAAPGIVMDALQKLDALAVADPAGTLKAVRAAVDLPRPERK